MLSTDQKIDTKYVIPIWQRDLQIERAIKAVKGRIEPHYESRSEPVAVVGYGPSLNDTWEKIRDFKYVFSCSGSHRFLIDRGIIPNWHVAVDPVRGNTPKLIGEPHKDVEYLIASTCHMDVFEHLKDYNVKLWHVFDNDEEGVRVLPRGEWAITGGCDVGLRCMAIARFFGFTDLHLFGLDGSSPTKTSRHADKHPRMLPLEEIKQGDRTFYTTAGMLAAVQGIWHELNQMADVTPHFYGDGLIQEMAKTWERKPPKKGQPGSVGFRKVELISASYRQLNEELHKSNLAYGVGGQKHSDVVQRIVQKMPPGSSVLDYGCGKGFLAKNLPFPIWQYDPAIEAYSETPKPADLVVCTDVLEHIEPDKLDDVLEDLKRCVKQVGYFTIHTGASMKSLADGRNAHLIQQKKQWWTERLQRHFLIAKMDEGKTELTVVVAPKMAKKKKAA